VIFIPNKCTKCGKIHPDDAKYLMEGCDSCGSKFFFYIRHEVLERAEKEMKDITAEEMQEIENDVREIVGREDGVEHDDTVILDVEAIRVIGPGKYRIDVTNLFTQKPLVIRVGPGKYELDLSSMMQKFRLRKSS
jgi:predicted  nucleic acid-binding Zn-ribbon protein